MDEKLKSILDRVLKLSKQNVEFDHALRKALEEFGGTPLVNVTPTDNAPITNDISNIIKKLDNIYEYCIEEVLQEQAKEFYKDFPTELNVIVPQLIKDYIRMESFRRANNFEDFCLALYQQIECITNKLCEMKSLNDIVEKMWGYSPYINITPESKKDDINNIKNRTNTNYSIALLILLGKDPENKIKKTEGSIQSLTAMEKARIIVYFLGYKTLMKGSDFDHYVEITDLIYDIYQCRNMNHRGNTLNLHEQKISDKILPLKSFYYFKFIGVLAQFVDYIKTGMNELPKIEEYANTIEKRPVKLPGPKIIGKIDLDKPQRSNKKKQ